MAQWLKVLAALVEDLKFRLQHPHGGSQSSLTPAQWDLMPSFGLCGYYTHLHIHTHTKKKKR